MRKPAIPKSIGVILLIVFLAAAVTDGLDDFQFGLCKVKAIGSAAPFSGGDAESTSLSKGSPCDATALDPWTFNNVLIFSYSSICMDSASPSETCLASKSDRAPPRTILS